MPQCVLHRAPNEREYGKTIVEINSSMTVSSASFLWQYNYTWEYHHLFLEWLWVVKDYRNLCLIKTTDQCSDHVANSAENLFWHPPL